MSSYCATSPTSSVSSTRDAAEADLVTVRVHVGDLADAVRILLAPRRIQPASSDLGHPAVEVIDDDGDKGMADTLGAEARLALLVVAGECGRPDGITPAPMGLTCLRAAGRIRKYLGLSTPR
jgi:hypothetical protein